MGAHESWSDSDAHRPESADSQAEQDARGHQPCDVRGPRRRCVGGGYQGGQADEDPPAVKPPGGDGHQRRGDRRHQAGDDDQDPCRTRGHMEAATDIGQQADGQELRQDEHERYERDREGRGPAAP